VIAALLLAAGFAAQAGMLSRTVTVGGTEYRYAVSVPPQWTPEKQWPVILFLHGSVERGDNGERPSHAGLGQVARQHPELYPALIVMPQCREGSDWKAEPMQAQALAALDASMKEFHGDPQRTYLTGFSMGGYGTWDLAAKHPRRFAALVVIAGGIIWPPPVPEPATSDNPYTQTARQIAGIPAWVFHGDADRNVLTSESRRMVAALRALNSPVVYTEEKGAQHFIAEQVYAQLSLVDWLLRQKRSTASP
jgi:predicted peptidase